MSETKQANSKLTKPNQSDSDLLGGYRWQVVFFSAVAFLLLVLVSRYLPYLQERAKFFTENALSLSILIAVIIQAIISTKQWKAMTDGVERTDRVVEKMQVQLEVMKDQAKAATAQAELAAKQIELMVLNECAYMTLGNWEIPPIRNQRLVINGKFINAGRTPALDFRRKIQIALGEGQPPKDWGAFDWDSNPDESGSLVIVANQEVNFSTPPLEEITDAMVADINKGKLVIVIDGQCRFFDTLGGKQIYRFGVTVELGPPPRVHIRYQNHAREKANP